MAKTFLAVLAGAALGIVVQIASSWAAKPGGTACGPNGLVCNGKQECCMSPAPFTFRCVTKGSCQTN